MSTEKPIGPEIGVEPEKIKLQMSWSGTLGMLLALYEIGDSKGRAHAELELKRMAELADRYVDMANS